MINPLEFVSQVKREVQRVTWPTSQETVGMSIAVILMVIGAMVYFFCTDSVICFCLQQLFGI
jgi:preprotein translocase subunit SecE